MDWQKLKKPVIVIVLVVVIAFVGYYLFSGDGLLANPNSAGAYTPSKRVIEIRNTWGDSNGVSYKGYKALDGETPWSTFAWNTTDTVYGRDKADGPKWFSENSGRLLGFFKGYDLNPLMNWDQVNNLAADIKEYLSKSGKHVDVVRQSEYLPNT